MSPGNGSSASHADALLQESNEAVSTGDIVEQWRARQVGRRPPSAPVRGTQAKPQRRVVRKAIRLAAASVAAVACASALYMAIETNLIIVSADAAKNAIVRPAGAVPVLLHSNAVSHPNAASVDEIERVAATFRETVLPVDIGQVVPPSATTALPIPIELPSDRLAAFDERVLVEDLPASARVEAANRVDEHTWEIETGQLKAAKIVLAEPVANGFKYRVRLSDRLREMRIVMTVKVAVMERAAQIVPPEPIAVAPKPEPKPEAVVRRLPPAASIAVTPKPSKPTVAADEPDERPLKRKSGVQTATRSSLGAGQPKQPTPSEPAVTWWQRPAPAWSGELKSDR